jgi:hypothetical protein
VQKINTIFIMPKHSIYKAIHRGSSQKAHCKH